jgi:hypothetical protein
VPSTCPRQRFAAVTGGQSWLAVEACELCRRPLRGGATVGPSGPPGHRRARRGRRTPPRPARQLCSATGRQRPDSHRRTPGHHLVRRRQRGSHCRDADPAQPIRTTSVYNRGLPMLCLALVTVQLLHGRQEGHAASLHWRKEPYAPARDGCVPTGQWGTSTPPPVFGEGPTSPGSLEELPDQLMGRGGIVSDRRESPSDHRAGEGST